MKLKENANPTGLRPETLLAIVICNSIYEKYGYDMTITSIVDGTHSVTSLHYSGCAFDLRTRDVEVSKVIAIFDEIKEGLPKHYDIVLESDHIHVEYQPRKS